MQRRNQQFRKQISLVGAIFGSLLLGLPAMAQMTPNSRPMNQKPANGDPTCSAMMNDMGSSRQGASAANSNRNTPSQDMTDSSASDRNLQANEEGSSSVNSNRNTPAEDSDRASTSNGDVSSSVSQNRPSGTINQGARAGSGVTTPNAGQMDTSDPAMCLPGNMNAPGSNSNRNKQMRRNDYNRPMMQGNPNNRVIVPTPEQRQNPSAIIRPRNGAVNVRLINDTGTNITYEVIGETNQRSLGEERAVSLDTLNTPTTITFYRPDGGFIRATTQAVAPGVLQVRLAPTAVFGMDKSALTVQPSGRAYLY